MSVDLFNNTSNDYISPNFQPCAGSGSQETLKFLDNGQVGIVSGTNIVSYIDFSSISIDIEGYNKEIKTLQSGEVVYIPGLTKGLLNKQIAFTIPDLSSNDLTLSPYFMILDFSINYYKNFRYTNTNIDTSSNYSQNITITNAVNLSLSSNNVSVSMSYDPSYFAFGGSVEGYDFAISNVVLTLIDASENSSSPFYADVSDGIRYPRTFTLTDISTMEIPYARYPNGGEQGVLLKLTYPTSSSLTIADTDKWLYLNHVRNEITTWELDASSNYQAITRTVDVGLSGSSTTTVMSAGDYLDYVTANEYWQKIGWFYLISSAPDTEDDDSISNLINGFYLYNPQTFPIKVEYMVFI
jgi:hypothetical protein